MNLGFRYILLLSLFVFACIAITSAQTNNSTAVTISELRAEPTVGSIRISWKSSSETNVDHYDIYRGTDINGPLTAVGNVQRGNFLFVDMNDLFKNASQFFCYKVVAVTAQGDIIGQSEIIGTSYNSTSSTAKRTWGSIKAMFRY